MGFGIQKNYADNNSILDLQEGFFTSSLPHHQYFVEGPLALITAQILACENIDELQNLQLNKKTRRQLIDYFNQYFALHISNFIELKTVEVLKEVLE